MISNSPSRSMILSSTRVSVSESIMCPCSSTSRIVLMRTFPAVSQPMRRPPGLPPYHHRSDAFVREKLEQECVVDTAVDDVRVLHPCFEGLDARVHFGDHSAADAPCLNRALRFCERHARDDRSGLALIALNTAHVGQRDKLAGYKRSRNISGDGVSVEIKAVTRVIDRNGGNDGDIAFPGHDHEDLWVDDFRFADPAEVDILLDTFIDHPLRTLFPRGDHTSVLPGQPDAFTAVLADERDEARVDVPHKDHAGDLQRLFVGDA